MRADQHALYRLGGVPIAIDRAIDELAPARVLNGRAELSIHFGGAGVLPATLPPSCDDDAWIQTRRTAAGYDLTFPDLAAFHLTHDGGTVHLVAATSAPPDTIHHLAIDHVLPLALTLRGHRVLHAAAVVLPQGVCAFAGSSGAGKSSLAAALAQHGCAVLTDDSAVVQMGQAEVLVHGLYPGLRLWEDSVAGLGDDPDPLPPVAHYTSKRRAPLRCVLREPRPLQHIYVLQRERGLTEPCIGPMSDRERFMALIESLFHLADADPMVLQDEFRFVDELLDRVQVERLIIPDDLTRLSAVARTLAEA